MDSGHMLAALAGIVFVGWPSAYFYTWWTARKIEALVPGGLRAWDNYDARADHQSVTGRIVTQQDGV